MRIEPPKPISTIRTEQGAICIDIPAKRNWFVWLFLTAWLCGWALGAVAAPISFWGKHAHPGAMAFMVVWLVVWLMGGFVAFQVWAWQMWGKQTITVKGQTLSIRRNVIGLGGNKDFDIAHISHLRVSPQSFNMFDPSAMLQSARVFWGMGEGVIAFDYGARVFRFGASVDEPEAQQIIAAIVEKVPALGERL